MNRSQHVAGWRALVVDLRRRGFFRRNTSRIVADLICHLTLLIGGTIVALVWFHSYVGWMGLLASVAGSLGVATNTHTASHGAVFRSARWNSALTHIGYASLLGLSVTFWKHKHCVLHHAHPNILGVDEDIDLMPFFALHAKDLDGAGGHARLYYRRQWLVAPLAISLNAFNMQRQGLQYLLPHLRRGTTVQRRRAQIDAACLLGHFVCFVGLPALVFSPGAALACYLLRSAMLSYLAFGLFAPSHWPEEAICAERAHPQTSFALQQTSTTVNYRLGPIGRFFAAGLDYQIEHHLFPRVDHTHYRAMSQHVRAFCRRNGLPYRCRPWPEALLASYASFRRPKPVAQVLGPGPASKATATRVIP